MPEPKKSGEPKPQSNETQPESQGPAVEPENVPTSAEVGAVPQGPVESAPPQPQEPQTDYQKVEIVQPEDEPAVYYGPGGIEAPVGEHVKAEYKPFTW